MDYFFNMKGRAYGKEAVSQVVFGQNLQDTQVVFLKNWHVMPVNLVNPVRKLLARQPLCVGRNAVT